MEPGDWGLTRNAADHLVLGGCDLVALAQRHGTPLHVADETALRRNCGALLGAVAAGPSRARIFYSYKSNCVPGLLRVLHGEGCGAEVISPYELWLARRLEVPPPQIIYNGVNKSLDDLRAAVELGVGLINVDSLAELGRLRSIARSGQPPIDVGIRVFPPVGWRSHFGVDPRREPLAAACREVEAAGAVNVKALHVHIGSGLRGTASYDRAIDFVCATARDLRDQAGVEIEAIDVGGGFGVPGVRTLTAAEVGLYRLWSVPPRPPHARACPSLEDFGRAVRDAVARSAARHGLREPEILLEPGRALTSSAQLLLLTVTEIKRRGRTWFAVVDGAMQQMAFPLSYEYHACLVASRASGRRPSRRYFVVGPLCSPEDVLYRNWRLPELSEGDVLAIMDAGAYFTSFANNFSFPRPPIALVRDGRDRLVRRRETFAAIAAPDDT
jgi:diaminopimelate decarboxylase